MQWWRNVPSVGEWRTCGAEYEDLFISLYRWRWTPLQHRQDRWKIKSSSKKICSWNEWYVHWLSETGLTWNWGEDAARFWNRKSKTTCQRSNDICNSVIFLLRQKQHYRWWTHTHSPVCVCVCYLSATCVSRRPAFPNPFNSNIWRYSLSSTPRSDNVSICRLFMETGVRQRCCHKCVWRRFAGTLTWVNFKIKRWVYFIK